MKTKQYSLILLFSFALFCMFYLYKSFLMNALIAGLICIATFDIKKRLDRLFSFNLVSSLLSVVFLMLFLILPLVFLIQQALSFFSHFDSSQLAYYADSSKKGFEKLLVDFPLLQTLFEDLVKNFSMQQIADWSLKISTYIGKESLYFFMDIGFIVLFLFLYFFYGRSVYLSVLKAIPFKMHQSHYIFEEVSGVLKIVLFASVVNVVLQGLAFGICVYYYDYPNAVILGILYGIASLIPVVGGALVWMPLVGYELFLGHTLDAFIIAVYSMVFIGFVIDNLIKPFIIGFVNKKILKKPLKINEIIIFFAIFAGFSSFGFWGLIIGPAITAFFIALLRLYQRKFY